VQGCYEKAQQFVGDQADILVGCAFAFAFSVVGVWFFLLLPEYRKMFGWWRATELGNQKNPTN